MKTNYIFPLLYFYLFELDISINTSNIYAIYINRICSMKILWQETKKKGKAMGKRWRPAKNKKGNEDRTAREQLMTIEATSWTQLSRLPRVTW